MTSTQPVSDKIAPSGPDEIAGFDRTASGVRFQSIASILLGTITGLLIGLPFSQGAIQGPLVLITSGLAGALIGYRRRYNPAFLYLCFAAILILSGTISSSFEPQDTAPTTTDGTP